MIKELLTFLIMPFTFCMILFVIGLLFLWLKKERIGWSFTLSGVVLLYFFGSWSGSTLLMGPLEREYSPLLDPMDIPALSEDEPPIIIVLASGHFTSDTHPITSQIGSISIIRLTEGLRIHHSIQGSKLVLMGGIMHRGVYLSDIKLKLMESIGIVPDSVTTLKGGFNTEEETLLIKELMLNNPNKPLILVTSASHMKRSMLLFQSAGMNPIAAPTQFNIMGSPVRKADYILWNPGRLSVSNTAIYEHAGLVWAKIRGKI